MYETYGLTVLKMHIFLQMELTKNNVEQVLVESRSEDIIDCEQQAMVWLQFHGFGIRRHSIARIYKLRTKMARAFSLQPVCTGEGLTPKYGANVGEIFLKNGDCHATAVT